MASHTLPPSISEVMLDDDKLPSAEPATRRCGAEMTNGETCDRPAGECQYHE